MNDENKNDSCDNGEWKDTLATLAGLALVIFAFFYGLSICFRK